MASSNDDTVTLQDDGLYLRKRRFAPPRHTGRADLAATFKECEAVAAPIHVILPPVNPITCQLIEEVTLEMTFSSEAEAVSPAANADFDRAKRNVLAVLAKRLPPPGP